MKGTSCKSYGQRNLPLSKMTVREEKVLTIKESFKGYPGLVYSLVPVKSNSPFLEQSMAK